jgi:NitT/TauT family transport system substrate-binding protein
MKRLLCVLASLGLAIGVVACSPATAPPAKDRLKLPGVLAYELTLPTLVAVAKDYFGDANIEIEDFVLGSGATVRNAVIAREYDFGLFAFVHVPLAREAKSPWKMLVNMHEHEAFSLIVRKDLAGTINSVADLRGKRVGFSTPGSGAWALGTAYLRKAGLDPERDLEFISLGGDANVLYTALATGKVDALVSWEPTTSRALAGGVAYPLILIWEPEEHRRWLGADSVLGFGLVTREDVIQAKPDLVRRMVGAEQRGLEFIRANSAESIAQVVLSNALTRQQFEGLEQALVVDIIERIKPGFGTGCLSRSGFQVEMDLSVEYQIVKAPITFDEFADPRWAGECAG